jgi:hypothetical protein
VAEGSLTKKLSSVKLSSIIITSVTISTSVIGDRGEREGREERGQGREREGERGEEGGGRGKEREGRKVEGFFMIQKTLFDWKAMPGRVVQAGHEVGEREEWIR